MTITLVKENLSALLHGGTLNKVRNIEALFQRAADTLLAKCDPIDTERIVSLSSTIYDDVYNYALPSDYKKLIDLYPQADRQSHDAGVRIQAEKFDLTKGFASKKISIESSEGTKFIRINWRTRVPKLFNGMNTLTANGTWSAVGSATGLATDTITKYSGSGSVRFNLVATGDGIQNTTMTVVDLTDEDEVADAFVPFYLKNSADVALLTSVTFRWGNDLTANYWTGVAQTAQADGTAFKVGWNLVKVPWSTATETGTVAPATVDSGRVTFAATAAITNIRVDNITFAIGKSFDIKYYSKFLFKNTAGTFITRPTTDDDTMILDSDAVNLFLHECLIAAAHQMEGVDSGFDINFARQELDVLYRRYRAEHPSQAKKAIAYYGGTPGRGRW